jgi:hypothetical protein
MADSMKGALERRLRNVRIRTALEVALRQVAVVLALAGLAAALAVAAERVLVIRLISPVSAVSAGAVGLLLAALLSAWRAPNRMQVAVLMDGRLGAKERFSTALALADSDDAFALAAEAEAHKAAEGMDIRGHFPIRPTLHWAGSAAAWVVAAAVFFLMPTMDVLGNMARQEQARQKAEALAKAHADVKQAAASVKSAVENAKLPQLATDLDKLAQLLSGDTPADVRREAIRKLTDLGKDLRDLQQQRQNSTGLGAAGRMLKDLRGTPRAFDNKLNQALANGDFAGAAKMIKDALEKLNSGQLSDAEKAALANQLADLASQAAKIGDPQKQMADMLARQGMDPNSAEKLAGMSQQDLREALKKQGLSDKQIDELMDKMSQCSSGAQACKNLAEKLAKCNSPGAGLNPDGLIALSEGLAKIAGEQVGEMATEDALRELEGAIARLGQGDCQGDGTGLMEGDPNGPGLWVPGENDGLAGLAGGGPGGRAWGKRPTGEPEDVKLQADGVRNKPANDTEIIGSWMVRGATVAGESKRKLSAAVQASKDAAAEAIRENKIPRKYEGAVKKYFGGMEQVAGADANQP